MTFKVLEIGDPEWIARVMALGSHRRDIHLDQRMLAPYLSAYRHRCGLAVTVNDKESLTGNGWVIQPLLINEKCELRHAYNFGGPVSNAYNISLDSIKEHADGVATWAYRHNAATEHATLLPSLVQEQLRILAPIRLDATYIKESVYVDVDNVKLRSTTRQLSNKAKSAGVVIASATLTPSNIEIFFEMYNKTMDRVNAKDHWRFSYQWFLAFAKFVKPELLFAHFDGAVQAGALVVYSQQYPIAYYHFAASHNRFPAIGISHMLVLAACEFIRVKQIGRLYLGGGVTSDERDNLLIFKAGFSKLRYPVYSYQRTLTEVTHDKSADTRQPKLQDNN